MNIESNLPKTVLTIRQRMWGMGLGNIGLGLGCLGISVGPLLDLEVNVANILFIFMMPLFIELMAALQYQFTEPHFDDEVRYPWLGLGATIVMALLLILSGSLVRSWGDQGLWTEFIRGLLIGLTVTYPLLAAIGYQFQRFYLVAGVMTILHIVLGVMGWPINLHIGMILVVAGGLIFLDGVIALLLEFRHPSEPEQAQTPKFITRTEQQTHRHFLKDGLLDILFGGYWAFLGIGVWYLTIYELNPNLLNILVLLFIMSCGVGIPIAKQYLSDPRIGYVQPKPISKITQTYYMIGSIFIILLLPVIAIGLMGLARNEVLSFDTVSWLIGLTNILFVTLLLCGILLAGAVIYKIRRYYGISALILIVNLGLFFLEMDLLARFVSSSLTSGAILLIAGIVTFIHFRSTNPVMAEEV